MAASPEPYSVATESEQTSYQAPNPGHDSPVALGIDLGTAKSSVALWIDGHVEVLSNSSGSSQIDSHVLFSSESTAGAVGRATPEQISSGSVVYGAKRLLGQMDTQPYLQQSKVMWPFMVQTLGIGVRPLIAVLRDNVWRATTPEEVLAIVVMELRRIAEVRAQRTLGSLVLTMPSAFSRFQQARLERICAMAGLRALRVMPEPSAAALVYAQQQQQADAGNLDSGTERSVLIVNLGASHCDVAVAATAGGCCQIKSLAGDVVGGNDVAQQLALYLAEEYKKQTGKSPFGDGRAMARLQLVAQDAMEVLSERTSVTVTFPSLDVRSSLRGADLSDTNGKVPLSNSHVQENDKGNAAGGGAFKAVIERETLEKISEPILQRCLGLVKQALSDARLEADGLADVALIGGCSHMPSLQAKLHDLVGQRSFYNFGFDQSEVIARGAVLEAAIAEGISDPNGGLDLLTIQAMPLSLGLALKGGKMLTILHRNSTIPVRRDVIVTTSHDNQTEALIQVYEGESPEAQDNHLLGLCRLSNIPRLPKGVPLIQVCMDVDASDTLRVLSGVYLPNQKEPAVPLVEVRMPTVDDGHGWCVEAIQRMYGTAMDVCAAPPHNQGVAAEPMS